MAQKLNLLTVAKNVATLGPGNRYVIWVQGCPFNCKGCITPEGIPLKINKLISIEDIANEIINDSAITGVTFSGGEPFLQASKLTKLINKIKEYRADLNYICFSGYSYEELTWVEATDLLNQLDLLIDGKYNEKLNNNLGLRGSSNQNFIFLSEKLKSFEEEFMLQSRNIDIRIGNTLQSIGIPNKSIYINI
jgi:anaerobic ribonucleoside-triphosphate reductase activating protein